MAPAACAAGALPGSGGGPSGPGGGWGVVWDKSGSKVVFIKSVILVELLPLPIAFYVNDAWAAAAWRQSFDFGSSRRRHRSSVG